MVWFFKKTAENAQNTSLSTLHLKVLELSQEIKGLKEQVEKLEIKALESRKLYHKKLKDLYSDEDVKSESNIKPSILLSPDGNFI